MSRTTWTAAFLKWSKRTGDYRAGLSATVGAEATTFNSVSYTHLDVYKRQIYYRFRRGQTQDTRFQNFGDRVKGLVELADSLAGKST